MEVWRLRIAMNLAVGVCALASFGLSVVGARHPYPHLVGGLLLIAVQVFALNPKIERGERIRLMEWSTYAMVLLFIAGDRIYAQYHPAESEAGWIVPASMAAFALGQAYRQLLAARSPDAF